MLPVKSNFDWQEKHGAGMPALGPRVALRVASRSRRNTLSGPEHGAPGDPVTPLLESTSSVLGMKHSGPGSF